MGATKEKLLRTLDILKTTDEQHPITTAKIIEQLREYGLEPERKSVLRDIKLLRDYGSDNADMDKSLTDRALEYAVKAHAGQTRKGTSIPYIVHPVEVMKIVAGITGDEEVRAAAVLHDTKEDAGATPEELAELFGDRVSKLVCAESEDKREDRPEKETWRIRKQETLDHVEHADRDVKIICLGDKLANMRDIARDFKAVGDDLWTRFNAPEDGKGIEGKKTNIGWYYRGIADRLKDELGQTAAWKELDGLVAEVFGMM